MAVRRLRHLTEGALDQMTQGHACAGFSYELAADPASEGRHYESLGYCAYNSTESIRVDIRVELTVTDAPPSARMHLFDVVYRQNVTLDYSIDNDTIPIKCRA